MWPGLFVKQTGPHVGSFREIQVCTAMPTVFIQHGLDLIVQRGPTLFVQHGPALFVQNGLPQFVQHGQALLLQHGPALFVQNGLPQFVQHGPAQVVQYPRSISFRIKLKNNDLDLSLQSSSNLPGPDLPCPPIYLASFFSPQFFPEFWQLF